MNRCLFLLSVVASALSGCAATGRSDAAALTEQVTAAELAFAKTMADRDHAAFSSFISEEAVFISGGKPVRGKLP